MRNGNFQLHKLRRAIQTQGSIFTFKKPSLNKFNEPVGVEETFEFRGILHGLSEYKNKTTNEGSTIRQRFSQMLLILWEDAEVLHHQDIIEFNGKPYRINEIYNMNESNLVADIHIEEVQT